MVRLAIHGSDDRRGLVFLETRALMGLPRLALATGDIGSARRTTAAVRIAPEDHEVKLVGGFLDSLPG